MRHVIALLVLMAMSLAACGDMPPPTVFVMEVTREVTREVIITATPALVSGALPLTTSTPSATPIGTPFSSPTPSVTPTPDVFPTPVVGQVFVADQVFEGGRMFWVQPVNQIWVLTFRTGVNAWQVYQDTYEDGMPDRDPAIVPPTGFYQPERGFGKLWRENPAIRDALGWATTEELGYNTRYEYHAGGFVDENNVYVPASGYHVLENLIREEFRFIEGAWTWELTNSP